MKTKTSMSIGLALTLVVGVFATMLALGLFTTTEVGAQSTASATRSFSPATVAPDGQVVVTITVANATIGSVTETLPTGFTYVSSSGAVVDTTNLPNVKFTLDFEAQDPSFTYTVTAPGADGGPHTFSGTLATTSDRADDVDVIGAPSVTVATVQTPSVITGVTVAHTPGGTSENARITVEFMSPTMLDANLDTITIEFEDDVQVPALLDERFISVVGEAVGGAGRTVVSPLDVTVQRVGTPADEPRVTLIIGDHDPAEDKVAGVQAGPVSVIFRQGAGIKNPTEAGTWNVKVETNKNPGFVKSKDDYSFKTYRTISLNAKSGKRESTITVSGAGFKNSTTATVFLDKVDPETMMPNGKKEPAEVVLCDAAIDSTDTFTCDLTVNVPPFSGGTNYINAIDGREGSANSGAAWKLDPQIKATPRTAAIGDTVTVDLLDFPRDSASATTFEVGGIEIVRSDGSKYLPGSGMTGTSTHTITIPNGVALGKQSLSIRIPGDTATRRVTMTITGAQLSVTPSVVVPNQSVTITGHGFTGNSRLGNSAAPAGQAGLASDETTLSGIHIGGTQIDWEKIDDNELIEIDSGGNWVATVVIPVRSPATISGVYELKAFDSDGRPGVTQITVKPRTVEFDPTESRLGTTVTVTGSGWVASNSAPGAESANISVDYYLPGESDSDASARANPDSDGNFTTTIRVPLNASIPSTNRVEVQYEDESDRAVTETAAHRVPGATISITPSSGPGGTLATLTGAGFKAFTTMTELEVGGTLVQPRPVGPSVNREGILQDTLVLVPGLDAGTHTVKVQVGDATVSAPFTITDDATLAPVGSTTADTAPADAFSALIENEVDGQSNLIGVFPGTTTKPRPTRPTTRIRPTPGSTTWTRSAVVTYSGSGCARTRSSLASSGALSGPRWCYPKAEPNPRP